AVYQFPTHRSLGNRRTILVDHRSRDCYLTGAASAEKKQGHQAQMRPTKEFHLLPLIKRRNDLAIADVREKSHGGAGDGGSNSANAAVTKNELYDARVPAAELVIHNRVGVHSQGPRSAAAAKVSLLFAAAVDHAVGNRVVEVAELNVLLTDHDRVARAVRDISDSGA